MSEPGIPQPSAPLERLLYELRTEAIRLGFSRLGVASTAATDREELIHAALQSWLEKGLAGPMTDWLTEHEPLRRAPQRMLPGVRTVIMLATDHSLPEPATARGGKGRDGVGQVAAYAQGDDYHRLLRQRVNLLGAWLEARYPGCRTRGVVDSAPFSEREFGWLAGLGWFGKNCMLIDPPAGSFFFLTALLTDLPFPVNEPIRVDHCGTCTACLDACPTGAFVAPRVLDANRCISGITIEHHGPVPDELRRHLGDWVFGCDVCQQVCPWNRHAPGSTEPTLKPRSGMQQGLLLVELLALDEEAFRTRFRGSAVLRAKRQGVLRSAALALGNAPSAAAAESLMRTLDDPDPVVRGAAAWALGRWRETAAALALRAEAALVARQESETDPGVRREIAAALAGCG